MRMLLCTLLLLAVHHQRAWRSHPRAEAVQQQPASHTARAARSAAAAGARPCSAVQLARGVGPAACRHL